MTNILQKIANDLLENKDLRVDINNEVDLDKFSFNISLFTYQQEALKNIIAILDLYYSDKTKLKNYYELKGFDEAKFKKENLTIKKMLNRASFWMATGSGKSIVMIKLIEVLYQLLSKNYIDKNDILILAPTDKILKQVKEHIKEFNKHSNFTLELNSLKDYEKIKNEKNLFTTDSINIFYYRSDLIDNESNVSKKTEGKRLNYENYINGGKWYIILDEAHKGKDELSAKKNYYNEMAENGFIFNFSATFVDNIDKISTIYNFNLAKFNEAGYGKNIKVVDEEFKGFNKSKNKEELNTDDKKDIILKSCILFTAQKKKYKLLKNIDKNLYHNPLMITVANTVNIKNADLKLYFLSLLEIAKDKPKNFDELKNDLSNKLLNSKKYIFGDELISEDFIDSINSVNYKDVLEYVFNSDSSGAIECKRTSLKDELLFKIKTSSKSEDFAMLKISDVKSWSNGILYGYDITEDISKKSYFDTINEKDSTINILMGSKIFSEGWDSNRPNIINFLNIGSANAKKYVMQTIGRGVRVEPIANSRKRLQNLSYEELNDLENKGTILENSNALESLFIFSTSKKDIDSIFAELPDKEEQFEKLKGINKISKTKMPLYIPKYKQKIEKQDVVYQLSKNDHKKINNFLKESSLNIILMNMVEKSRSKDLAKSTIDKLTFKNAKKYFTLNGIDTEIKELNLINKIDKFFNAKLQDIDEFVELSDEIKHYKDIKVNMAKVSQSQKEDIENDIINSKTSIENRKEYLKKQFDNGKITIDELMTETQKISLKTVKNSNLVEIKNLKKHFYTPILMKDKNENDFFRNIVNEKSEIDFINNLEDYLEQKDNKLSAYDNWYFSKIQQVTDSIYIPYIDYEKSQVAKFYPDFIFWLKKDDEYIIKFIDPKGLNQGVHKTKDKLEGFEKIFINDGFHKKYPTFKIELYLYNIERKKDELIDKYVEYDFDDIF
ncbi:MAG: DEAD/DEAH box helicase family protein [Campylobacterota bacterium]|nr:DEAD/DEAH box helicase family protein [Campylobacterota bacterium]